jgi:hypothetical protein
LLLRSLAACGFKTTQKNVKIAGCEIMPRSP